VSQAIVVSTACFYPYIKSAERFARVAKWAGHLLVWDDHNDSPEGDFGGDGRAKAQVVYKQFSDAADRLEGLYVSDEPLGKPPIGMSGWRPYVLCVSALAEEMMDGMNRLQKCRFLDY
jgi:hypothetical protein